MIYIQLFWGFLQVGMFSIGGGYAAMPLLQALVVEQHPWLSMSEFADLVTIAEMTPGPIMINAATFVGVRMAGIPGGIVASVACVISPMVICSLLSFLYYRYKKMDLLQNVLKCMRPAVTGLIAGAGYSIIKLVIFRGDSGLFAGINWGSMGLFAGAFLILRKLKWSPILLILLCGLVSLTIGVIRM